MAIALVQTATVVELGASGATSYTITINGVVGGNAIVTPLGIWDNDSALVVTDVTDGGNTYTVRSGVAEVAADYGVIAGMAYAVNVTGGNRTVSWNLTGQSGSGVYTTLGCWEFSGVKTSTPEDTWDTNENINTSGATDASAGPITTTDAGDLLVGVACNTNVTDTAYNWGSPASWSNSYRQNNGAGASGMLMDAGYWIPAATQTTYTAQWSHDNNASDLGVGTVVALLPAAAAAVPPEGIIRVSAGLRPSPFKPGLAR